MGNRCGRERGWGTGVGDRCGRERERVGHRCGRERGCREREGGAQVWERERERVGHRCEDEDRCEREATLLPPVGPAEGLQCQS